MDTMITAEKHNQCPNVINCYRKILGNKRCLIYIYLLITIFIINNINYIF